MDYNQTKDCKLFPVGSIVECHVPGIVRGSAHPREGELYEVLDCYFYLDCEFIDIKSLDGKYRDGGWFCDSFNSWVQIEPKPEQAKKEEQLWRRISLE